MLISKVSEEETLTLSNLDTLATLNFKNMLLLGIVFGSSSARASLINGESGKCLASAFHPKDEMEIIARKPRWAEQNTEIYWSNLKASIADFNSKLGPWIHKIGTIGLSYQMHGLATVDIIYIMLRPSFIWCNDRAVEYSEKAFNSLGKDFCVSYLLNSTGNFYATS